MKSASEKAWQASLAYKEIFRNFMVKAAD